MKDTHLDIESDRPKEIIRLKEAEEFFCFRCNTTKKSKIKVIWNTSEGDKIICNGCYGLLISKTKSKL